jgi:hypothetical protein
MEKITVVLNGFKRAQHLQRQMDCVESQTVKANEVLFWQNKGDVFDETLTNKMTTAKANANFGVWARFAYALNAKSEYVCVIDDDTMPGNRWFENCLETIRKYNGLLGTIGIRYHTMNGYFPSTRYGWANPNEETVEVDIVGHAWFFKREWLSYMWRELPSIDSSFIVGEDIHFSHMLWKHARIGSFVPPHPKECLDLWGSLPNGGIGSDDAATYRNQTNMMNMNRALLDAIAGGFVPLAFRPGVQIKL